MSVIRPFSEKWSSEPWCPIEISKNIWYNAGNLRELQETIVRKVKPTESSEMLISFRFISQIQISVSAWL